MPWKKSRASDERLKFVAHVLSEDSTMTDLFRHFGVSRKTGSKWKKRYEVGISGLGISKLSVKWMRAGDRSREDRAWQADSEWQTNDAALRPVVKAGPDRQEGGRAGAVGAKTLSHALRSG